MPMSIRTEAVSAEPSFETLGAGLRGFPRGRHQQRQQRPAPALSLVVGVTSGGALLDGLLESLARQSHPGFEVIFVEATEAPTAACPFAEIVDRAIVYRFGAGGTTELADLWNQGLALARGDFVAVLEIGCLLDAAFTARLVATLTANPALAVAQCAHVAVRHGHAEPTGYRPSSRTVLGAVARRRASDDPRFAAVPSAVVLRRAWLPAPPIQKRGGFRDVALEALAHGDLAYVHEALVAVVDPDRLPDQRPAPAATALPSDPRSTRAVTEAEAAVAAGKPDEAERILRSALAETPMSAEILNDLGALAFARGEVEDARTLLQSALEADESHAQARDNLAAFPAPPVLAPPPIPFVGTPGPSQVDLERYTTPATCQIPDLAALYTRELGFRRDGVFVEVGAFDGEYVSNTSNLADLGWRGHYIEPVPAQAAACRARHARNPRTRVFELAIADRDGEADIFVGGPLSTMSSDALKLFQSFPWAKGFHSGQAVRVRQSTLDHFLADNQVEPGFDVLSIDVEGFELNVMRGFDLSRWRPRLIIVELHDDNEAYAAVQADCREVARLIAAGGYHPVFKDKTNTVYARAV